MPFTTASAPGELLGRVESPLRAFLFGFALIFQVGAMLVTLVGVEGVAMAAVHYKWLSRRLLCSLACPAELGILQQLTKMQFSYSDVTLIPTPILKP